MFLKKTPKAKGTYLAITESYYDKEKKAMEALAAKASAKEAEDEKPVEKKNRSIAERAKLVSALEEAEETEKMNSTRKTEE